MIAEMFPSGSSTRKARIEIIPLIDVIFFLLATFVLFTVSLSKLSSLEVMLPQGGTPPDGPDLTVNIQASSPGAFYWKQGRDSPAEFVTVSELPGRLLDYKRRIAEPRVFIRGDDLAEFGATIRILDEAHKAGINEVAIETRPSKTGS